MPKHYPQEFGDDAVAVAVAVARKRESSLRQIVKDCKMIEACLSNWLKKPDAEG